MDTHSLKLSKHYMLRSLIDHVEAEGPSHSERSQPLNDFYRYFGSARQGLECCRTPALHWYESGLVE